MAKLTSSVGTGSASRKTVNSTTTERADAVTLLNAVFEGIEDGIFLLGDSKLTILRTNSAASRILEIPVEKLIGKSVLDFVADSAGIEEIKRVLRMKLKSNEVIHFDIPMVRRTGGDFPALHNVSEIKDGKGERIGLMWIVNDVSHGISLNRALSELETRYRLLFNRSADATLIIDLEDLTIIDANDAALKQLGYTKDEILHKSVRTITPTERWDKMIDDFNKLNRDVTLVFDGINLTKSGNMIPVQISAVLTEIGGRSVIITSSRDTSHQRIIEKQRIHTQQLEVARQTAGGLAHELSQPLQVLTTIVDLIEQEKISEAEVSQLVKKISPVVERMSGLVKQMQKITKLETKPYTGDENIIDIGKSSK